MVFPAQTITVVDPGIPLAQVGPQIPLKTGCCNGGSAVVNTLYQINGIALVRSVLGYGPLAEDVALTLQKNGGPVNFVVHNVTGTALSSHAMTQEVGSGQAPTISGTPYDRYGLTIVVVVGGAVATATFKYSLDNWAETDSAAANVSPTWSNIHTTASTFVIPGTGLTINFGSGTYVAGDTFFLATVPGEVTTTDLGTVITLLEASPTLPISTWQICGTQVVYTTAATLAAAFQADLVALTNSYRFPRGLIDIGSGDTEANVYTEAASWTGSRVCPCYGYELVNSALPFEGYTARKVSCVSSIGTAADGALISTDLSATAAVGARSEVLAIYYDGFQNQALDSVQISTMRTWTGMPGFYIAGAKLKCAFGSDFTDLQYGRVMDAACLTTYQAQFIYQSANFRATGTGTINPFDASNVEKNVQGQLNDVLIAPSNATGTPGHVSAVVYDIDLANNIVSTQQLISTVDLEPLGYAKLISTTLQFQLIGG
jgi:hypothetical protein